MCLCLAGSGVSGEGGEWVEGVDQDLEGWGDV